VFHQGPNTVPRPGACPHGRDLRLLNPGLRFGAPVLSICIGVRSCSVPSRDKRERGCSFGPSGGASSPASQGCFEGDYGYCRGFSNTARKPGPQKPSFSPPWGIPLLRGRGFEDGEQTLAGATDSRRGGLQRGWLIEPGLSRVLARRFLCLGPVPAPKPVCQCPQWVGRFFINFIGGSAKPRYECGVAPRRRPWHGPHAMSSRKPRADRSLRKLEGHNQAPCRGRPTGRKSSVRRESSVIAPQAVPRAPIVVERFRMRFLRDLFAYRKRTSRGCGPRSISLDSGDKGEQAGTELKLPLPGTLDAGQWGDGAPVIIGEPPGGGEEADAGASLARTSGRCPA